MGAKIECAQEAELSHNSSGGQFRVQEGAKSKVPFIEPKISESCEDSDDVHQEPVEHVNPEAKTDEPGEPAADKQPVREKTPLEYVQGFLNLFTERSKGNLSQVTTADAAKASGLDPTQ